MIRSLSLCWLVAVLIGIPVCCDAVQTAVSPAPDVEQAEDVQQEEQQEEPQDLLPEFPDALAFGAPESLDELKQLEARVKEVLEKVSPATVSVSGGSGVVINAEGLILTVAHVNQRAGRRVRITFPDGRRVNGITLGNNDSLDAGMIRITSEGEWPYVPMGVSAECEPGQWCMAIGFPVSYTRGDEPAVRLGRILSSTQRTIVTDCTIMGGDSGGPLFDLDGNVIGVSSRVGGSLNANVHVPVDVYREDWDRFVASEDWNQNRSPFGNTDPDRGYLGVQSDGTDSARIGIVVEGGAADQAGIEAGDTIVAFNGKEVNSFNDLREVVGDAKAGDVVKVKVQRNGATMELNVTLGRR